jgi:hypothetical protein
MIDFRGAPTSLALFMAAIDTSRDHLEPKQVIYELMRSFMEAISLASQMECELHALFRDEFGYDEKERLARLKKLCTAATEDADLDLLIDKLANPQKTIEELRETGIFQ